MVDAVASSDRKSCNNIWLGFNSNQDYNKSEKKKDISEVFLNGNKFSRSLLVFSCNMNLEADFSVIRFYMKWKREFVREELQIILFSSEKSHY